MMEVLFDLTIELWWGVLNDWELSMLFRLNFKINIENASIRI